MTQDMKRNIQTTNCRHLRRLILLLLMLCLEVSKAWGTFSEGLYYIKSNASATYYLCPAIGCYYNNNVDQPHLTTFQTNGDQNSVWKIVLAETVGTLDYYYLIHYKTGKYLKSNSGFSIDGGSNRKAVHLEEKPSSLDEYFEFCIKDNSGTYQIYPKKYDSDASSMSFNPKSGNQDCYVPQNGVAYGIIGLWSSGDGGSKWIIESIASTQPCATPIIKYDGDNITISYPYSDETDVTIYYTTDGTAPSTSSSPYTSPFPASGVLKVRAIATKSGLDNSDEAVLLGSARPFLIQSKECTNYYLVPSVNESNVNTSSIPGTSMQWTLQNAGASTGGIPYYYLVNSNGNKIQYAATLAMNSASADDNKFCIIENGYNTGDYFLIPISATSSCVFKKDGNVSSTNCTSATMKNNDTGYTSNQDKWTLRVCNNGADQKNLFANAPFSVSDDNETHYYHIESVGTSDNYIIPPSTSDGYATTSTTGYDDVPWLFKVADSDNWLTYYYIINAATGEYMYFNPNNNQTKDQTNAISMKDVSEKNASNEEKFQFIMVRSTTTDACYIVPKGYSYADASHIYFRNNTYFGIWLNESGPLKATWSRSSTANNVKWTFEEATITSLYLDPVFSEDENGIIKITHPAAACDIYYTSDGTDPSSSTDIYDNANGLSSSTQRRIKAIAKLKNDPSVVSGVITLLNMPDVTLAGGPYTYDGTARVPSLTVSVGETAAPTSPVTYTATYANNINAGTASVTVEDADANDNWYIWDAPTATFTIGQAPLTVTANDKTIGYGEAPANDGVTYSGFVNSETETVLGGTLTYTYNYEQFGHISDDNHSYTITPSGLTSSNYDISFVAGTLTVTEKHIDDGTGTNPSSDIIVSVGAGNTIILTQGAIPLTLDTDYTVGTASTSASGKYTLRTVTGTGNYTGSFTVRNAIAHFQNDGNGGTEYSATFVAEGADLVNPNSSQGHALPTGITAFIVTSISGNVANAVALDYIPEGIPVLLLSSEACEGFFVQDASGQTTITSTQINNNMLEEVTTSTPDYNNVEETEHYQTAHFNVRTIYLLSHNEFVYNMDGYLGKGKVYLNPNHSSGGGGGGSRLQIRWNTETGIAPSQLSPLTPPPSGTWYTLDGRRLNGKPVKKGLYLQNGQKTVVR